MTTPVAAAERPRDVAFDLARVADRVQALAAEAAASSSCEGSRTEVARLARARRRSASNAPRRHRLTGREASGLDGGSKEPRVHHAASLGHAAWAPAPGDPQTVSKAMRSRLVSRRHGLALGAVVE